MPARKIPLALKIVYTLFVCILVPIYWYHYGPANFLWFSDVALLLAIVALWRESPLLASMQAVSVGFLESAWVIDFLAHLIAGAGPIGLADYMFQDKYALWLRCLSLFHFPLPLILLWTVHRLGYDRRALLAQTVLAWAILLVCYFFTKPSENINWVFGFGPQPQQTLSPPVYFGIVLLAFPLVVYAPSHLLLKAIMPGVVDKTHSRENPSAGS